MKLKFTGSSHERSFTKADFTRHGIDDGAAVRFNESNNWVADVPDSVATYLLAEAPDEYREATDDDETEQDMTRVGTTPRALRGSAASGDDAIDSIPVSPGAGGDDSGTAGTRAGGRSRGGRS